MAGRAGRPYPSGPVSTSKTSLFTTPLGLSPQNTSLLPKSLPEPQTSPPDSEGPEASPTYLGGLILRPLSRFSRNSLRWRRERRPWSRVGTRLVREAEGEHTPAPSPAGPALTEYMAFSSSRALACLMASASSLSFRSILKGGIRVTQE